MKYLIFNAAVFLALGYLIVGGDTQNLSAKVQHTVEKAKAQVERVVEKTIVEKVVQPLPSAKPQPVQKVVETVAPKPVAPPPLPEAVEVARSEPKKVPSRTREIIEEATPIAVVAEVSAPEVALSDTKERSKQLRQMVAEMEQMFAEKMTR